MTVAVTTSSGSNGVNWTMTQDGDGNDEVDNTHEMNYSLQWKSSRSFDADVADTTDWPDDGIGPDSWYSGLGRMGTVDIRRRIPKSSIV